MSRWEARRAVVPDERLVRKSPASGFTALRSARPLSAKLLRMRRAWPDPYRAFARSVIYAFEDSPVANAYCRPLGRHNVIVITTGLLSLIDKVIPLLAALRGEDLGGTDDGPLADHFGDLLRAVVLAGGDRDAVAPNEIARAIGHLADTDQNARWAGALLEFMTLFILEHEWAHVRFGHLDLPNLVDDSGRPVLREMPQTVRSRIHQASEIHADVAAMGSSLHGLAACRARDFGLRGRVDLQPDALYALGTAVSVTFLLSLYTTFPTQFAAMRLVDHPPSYYRVFAVSRAVRHHFTGNYWNKGDMASDIGTAWLSRTVAFQKRTRLWILEQLREDRTNLAVFMPEADQAAEYDVSLWLGFLQWPPLHVACMDSLVYRVVGPEAVAEWHHTWQSQAFWKDSLGP